LKKLSYCIQNFSKIAEGDGVLGVNGRNEILKYGYVISSKNYEEQNNRLILKFDWVRAQPIKLNEDFFDPELEIQRLRIGTINKIDKIVDIFTIEEKYYAEGDSKYASPVKPSLSFITEEGKELTGFDETTGSNQLDLVPLFYGTNRNKTGSILPNEYYGSNVDELKYGLCAVSIPKKHKMGVLERPGIIWNFLFGEDTIRHVVLNNIKELTEDEFTKHFNGVLELNPEKDALIFLHGYNNTFADAARRTGQLVYDMKYKGLSAMFSWASDGKTFSYVHDLKTAQNSTEHFKEFIVLLLNKTNIEKLHLVAHSMGTTVLAFTLEKLINDASLANKLNIIKQIVLGAGDLEQGTFKSLLRKIKNIGSRRTIYASDNDSALAKSIFVSSGLLPIGKGGSDLFVENDVDSIDATHVKSDSKHGYIFEAKELLYDLYYLLREGFEPAKRKLSQTEKSGIPYWYFPE